MPSESFETVENYLKDVDEQISCKIGLESVNNELRGHIEDKAALYMEYGLEEQEAYRRAVRDMGAADVVGMELNKHHRLRTAKPLLAVILVLMILGVTGQTFARGIGLENTYYLVGLLVLAAVMWFGYPFLLKHTKMICGLFLAACLVLGIMYLCPWLWPDFWEGVNIRLFIGSLGNMYSPSFYFGMAQIAVPVGAVLFYRRRHHGLGALFLLFVYQAVLVLIADLRYWGKIDYTAILFLLICCLGTELYAVKKGWISISGKKGAAAAFLSFLALLVLWAVPQWGSVKENWEVFVNPGKRASVTNAWDDAYNNVLIRELLGRTQLFGGIALTDEELVRYQTSQWYYEDGEGSWNRGRGESSQGEDDTDALEWHAYYKMQGIEVPSLRQILPQHYMRNYRISWWVLRYGWIPAILLTLLCLSLPVLALWTALRIRNPLGRLTAFAGALVLTVQTVFYIIGSMGCQFGGFSNLPFVSEGKVSLVGSAVLAGLILSAYRFDTVMEEKEGEMRQKSF